MTALILLKDWQESQIEFWKPIYGCFGYDVSNMGRIRSFRRQKALKGHGRKWASVIVDEPRILKCREDSSGYPQCCLRCDNGERVSRKVHILVATAFLPNTRNLPEVNHKTGLKIDARVDNLEWCTRLENARHAARNGLRIGMKGEQSPRARLTADAVRSIRQLKAQGVSVAELAVYYGMQECSIYDVVRRRSWRSVE